MGSTPQNLSTIFNTAVLVVVVVATITIAPTPAAATVYGDPVFDFVMDNVPSVDGFFDGLQYCLGLTTSSLTRTDSETVVDGDSQSTITFTLADSNHIKSLKQSIDSDDGKLKTCLHDRKYIQLVSATYDVAVKPSPSDESNSKMLIIGLSIGGVLVLAVIALAIVLVHIRRRNAKLEEEEYQRRGDLNQPLSRGGGGAGDGSGLPPPARKPAAKKPPRQEKEV